jgi:hypothetical protein
MILAITNWLILFLIIYSIGLVTAILLEATKDMKDIKYVLLWPYYYGIRKRGSHGYGKDD